MIIVHYDIHTLIQHAHPMQPGLGFFIADWQSCHNNMENQDQKIPVMNVIIHTVSTSVDIPSCGSIEDETAATEEDAELQMLKNIYFIDCHIQGKG